MTCSLAGSTPLVEGLQQKQASLSLHHWAFKLALTCHSLQSSSSVSVKFHAGAPVRNWLLKSIVCSAVKLPSSWTTLPMACSRHP